MNHNLIYLFGMYEPDTDSIVVYANDSIPFKLLIVKLFCGVRDCFLQ